MSPFSAPDRVSLPLPTFKTRSWIGGMVSLAIALASPVATHLPAQAADYVLLKHGVLDIKLSLADLETYAQTGTAPPELATYLDLLAPGQVAQLRSFLQLQAPLLEVEAKQLLGEPMVQDLMRTYFSRLIQTTDQQNSEPLLHAAMVESTRQTQTLSLLGLLKAFPGDVSINVPFALQQMRALKTLRQKTRTLVQDLEATTTAIAATESLPTPLKDLRQPGPLPHTLQTLTLNDTRRKRRFEVDLYLPKTKGKAPVILIENGLGSRRDRLSYVAEHLASYGFAVAIPDHPGSDYQQQRQFINRTVPTFFVPQAFVDRPLDDTYLLNELERLNSSQFQGRLDPKQVGVLGFSLGGTTALALAGATFNYEQLQQDCGPQRNLLNLSLFFQCRALSLPQKPHTLRDSRVKAAFIFFPFSSSLYSASGLRQINIPIFWQALAEDFVTPVALEQLPAFSWLSQNPKYLAIVSGFGHVDLKALRKNINASKTKPAPLARSAAAPAKVPVRESKGIQSGLNTFSLAFFKAHVAQDRQYLPYLQASYAKAFSKNSRYGVSFVQSLTPEQLALLKGQVNQTVQGGK